MLRRWAFYATLALALLVPMFLLSGLYDGLRCTWLRRCGETGDPWAVLVLFGCIAVLGFLARPRGPSFLP